MSKDGKWRESYVAALLELNPAELGKKIVEAKTAICCQHEELVSICTAEAVEELRAMDDALNTLNLIARRELESLRGPAVKADGRTKSDDGLV